MAEDYVSVAAFQVMTGVCFPSLSGDFLPLGLLHLAPFTSYLIPKQNGAKLPPLVDRGQGRGSGPEGKPLLLQLLSSLSHHRSPGLGGLDIRGISPEELDLALVWG